MTRSREDEAREALERVARDSETLGTSSLARIGRRLGDHFAARDAVGTGRDAPGTERDGETDPIELWGRRIGRGLSLVGFVVLTLWLLAQLKLI
jgi:hypothetical protein